MTTIRSGFLLTPIAKGHTSQDMRNDTALSEQLPILAAPLQFVASYAVNPRENCSETTIHWPHLCR